MLRPMTVVVPRDLAATEIQPGSALLIRQVNADSVSCAVVSAGRLPFADLLRAAERAPTVQLSAQTVVAVGWWEVTRGELILRAGASGLLAGWLRRPVHRNELHAADGEQNARDQARRDARRLHLQGRVTQAAALRARHGVRGW